jgi:SpoVK/Ycf46/Vps4 family AAA+-type ATPase
MPTTDQVMSLAKAHLGGDNERFKTTLLQIAAHEAQMGHAKTAGELKALAEKKTVPFPDVSRLRPNDSMLEMTMPDSSLSQLVVKDDTLLRIQRILDEYRNKKKLHAVGLDNRRKILIEGLPGTGKTFTASVVASELGLPLYTLQVDKLVTKFLGETSVRLRQVFDTIRNQTGVYLFDEFDAIGADRGTDNEVGEMRRILNSMLQFLDNDLSESLIIAVTNNQTLLDKALFRRFDDVLHYDLPSKPEIIKLMHLHFGSIEHVDTLLMPSVLTAAEHLSQAEIVRICDDAMKSSILTGKPVSEPMLLRLLQERHEVYTFQEAK